MTTHPWQLDKSIDAILFDCDGTLSHIEGIDELARMNHVGKEVEILTYEAMAKTGLDPDLYQKRLALVNPTQEQIRQLGDDYFKHRSPFIDDVLHIFTRLNKTIYIVSAGLYPSIVIFGSHLKIPQQNIFAVEINFDEHGYYQGFDHHSPLILNDGKRKIVNEIKKNYKNLAYVGDGLNDLSAYDLVTRFIGYGGSFYRENIASKCEFYIDIKTTTPLLPLILTKEEIGRLETKDYKLYEDGMDAISQGKVQVVRRA